MIVEENCIISRIGKANQIRAFFKEFWIWFHGLLIEAKIVDERKYYGENQATCG